MLRSKGPMLTIDLQNQRTTTTNIDEILSKFIGGRGAATKLAHDRIPFQANPLGVDNRIYLTTGPMQTSTMSFTGRMNATSVSPLTDGLLSSNAGGFMSRNFADTGYSAVEITNRSDELIIIHVRDDGVRFEPVSELSEATVPETCDYIEDKHDMESDHVACIGPAGENEVRYASIMTTEERAFGRGGLGAVLGAKNVKAVTVSGDSRPEIDIPATQMEIHRDAATDDHIMKRQGTVAVMDLADEMDGLPSYYFSERSFDGVEGINGSAVEEKKYQKGTCSSCAFACKLPTKDEERGVETEGPEFETAMALGSNAGVDDIAEVMASNELCDRYGLDTISTGNTISGYLASENEFGNVDLIQELVEKIAYRKGVGDHLAEGIARVADDLSVPDWTVKRMDFAAHEGRLLNGQALGYATSNRGADHMYSTFYSVEYPLVEEKAMPPSGFEGKAVRLIERENLMAINDAGVVCKFSRDYMTEERYESLFGIDYESLLEIGGEIIELERHFNNQRGFDQSHDQLPYDLDGFEEALSKYYNLRGWTSNGIAKLE